MKQIICNYCGEVINESFSDYRGDLDSHNLACIEIKPRLLNKTDTKIDNPDLCRTCIIKALKG